MAIANVLSPSSFANNEWQHARPLVNSATIHRNGAETGWDKAFAKLDSFRHLEEDWDGQGAHPPSSELIDSALGLALLIERRGMQAPTAVAPGPMGSLTLVWQEASGAYCEVELEEPFHAEVMLLQPGQPPQHWTLPVL